MPQQTSNYNLTKPLASEFYNVQVQNSNMDIIDGALKINDNSLTTHLADSTPHKFIDGTNTYKYGFKTNANKDGLIFVYEEVL